MGEKGEKANRADDGRPSEQVVFCCLDLVYASRQCFKQHLQLLLHKRKERATGAGRKPIQEQHQWALVNFKGQISKSEDTSSQEQRLAEPQVTSTVRKRRTQSTYGRTGSRHERKESCNNGVAEEKERRQKPAMSSRMEKTRQSSESEPPPPTHSESRGNKRQRSQRQ